LDQQQSSEHEHDEVRQHSSNGSLLTLGEQQGVDQRAALTTSCDDHVQQEKQTPTPLATLRKCERAD